jgi:magnesium chelatase subunit H
MAADRARRRGAAGGAATALRFVLVTLDSHLAGSVEGTRRLLARDLPGLDLRVHVAADWERDPAAAERCREDIAGADFIVVTQLFLEAQVAAVLPAIAARRGACDAVMCAVCAPELVRLTRMGRFTPGDADSSSPFSPMALLKKLRGSREDGKSSGERQMTMLRRLPKLLRFVPGTAQDVRAYFLAMQCWLAGSEANVATLVRLLVDRYAAGARAGYRGAAPVGEPVEYPSVGLYHPATPAPHIADGVDALPARGAAPRVGVLLFRSYILAGNTAHYDAVIAALEARGLAPVPAFNAALDSRPAIDRYFRDASGRATVDAVISLTGFSLVGGPAYNDTAAAAEILGALDVPYLSLQTLEFQTKGEWEHDPRGLNALQATLQVALPELDGATGPLVYGGREEGVANGASAPYLDRVELLASRVARLVRLRRTARAERRVAVVLFNFPPNAGNTGSAAYLACFDSLYRTLTAMKAQGYTVELPASVDALRAAVTEGNRERLGAPANVHARVPADEHVRREPFLEEIERTWGPAPGKLLTDGASLFVMGAQLGNVFVGVQPSFGWEGDPMRLLFESSFAPTHAFCAFYRWLREDFGADVALHFGTHGALEFLPGKQVGLTGECWPERLLGDLPSVYLYASNNPSEGTLAKRRAASTLVSYLTPPLANSGLYRGLADLKATIARLADAAGDERVELLAAVEEQAAEIELAAASGRAALGDAAWLAGIVEELAEVERELIPVGLHTVGEVPDAAQRAEMLRAMGSCPRPELGLAPLLASLVRRDGRAEGDEARESAAARCVERLVDGGSEAALALAEQLGYRRDAAAPMLAHLADVDARLRTDHEIPGILRALDGRFVAPAPGGDVLRNPEVLPTGRNTYGFDPYRIPSAAGVRDGRRQAEALLARHVADGNALPPTVGLVLWGTDNMKTEGAPIALALALMGAVPRFDSMGRLAGARLIPLETLGRPRVDVVVSLSGVFRDLFPLQTRLLAEAALLAARADEPEDANYVRRHALAAQRETGCDLETAALRVFSNAEGAYGSNVNLVIDTGQWQDEDELADVWVKRKSFAYTASGASSAAPELMRRALGTVALSYQNLDSVELGATDIDQYVESLGGMARAAKQQRGAGAAAAPTYMGDFTTGTARVRTLSEQVALEARTRTLNPKWYEAQLAHGYEGVRNIASRAGTTLGWSATAGGVAKWVYDGMAETFILDPEMRRRMAEANPSAAAGMATRLLEATDRGYWKADAATVDALRDAAAELEDRLEGVYAPA